MKYVKLVFSPTGGTEKAAEIVASEWSEAAETIDLTDAAADFSKCRIEPDDLVLIALPSYGGRVPRLAAERLSRIQGNRAKCVLMCVYGNRAYEDTLIEMADIAKAAGFSAVAAISAVAEHSIMREYASGRPDREDEGRLKSYDCLILGKSVNCGFSCVGGYQPASAVSVVLISMYSAIRRNSSANLK